MNVLNKLKTFQFLQMNSIQLKITFLGGVSLFLVSATLISYAVITLRSASLENAEREAHEEISASAEEMSAQVEEVTASAQSLADMAQTLQQIVTRFKLSGTQRTGTSVEITKPTQMQAPGAGLVQIDKQKVLGNNGKNEGVANIR